MEPKPAFSTNRKIVFSILTFWFFCHLIRAHSKLSLRPVSTSSAKGLGILRRQFRMPLHQLMFTTQPTQLVDEAAYQKVVVRSLDGYHWNEKDHELVSAALFR
jgi:hypothetical protein